MPQPMRNVVMMRRWIVFRADKRQPGWQDRKYAHTGSLTKTLGEHYDCSDTPLPEVGYRPPEFIKVEQFVDAEYPEAKTHLEAAWASLAKYSFVDAEYPEAKTHHRLSDWEVTSVETYTPDISGMGFDMIVICYCKYVPINAALQPMPERQMPVKQTVNV
jgi:hypothetical protein